MEKHTANTWTYSQKQKQVKDNRESVGQSLPGRGEEEGLGCCEDITGLRDDTGTAKIKREL